MHVAAEELAGGQAVLGILPCGTANNVATSLGISQPFDEALPVHLDEFVCGTTPATFENLPGALRVIVQPSTT